MSDPTLRTTDDQLQAAAHKAVTDFVNAQHCQSKADVATALRSLGYMAACALDLVMNGQCEKLS